MSCQQVPTTPAFNLYPRSVQVGEFEVAISGGVWVAIRAARFKAVVGDTPADYLAHWRLTLAQAHLRAGRSLKSIAHELGYANPSALSRVFAQKLGMSARDWREAVDEGR